MPQCDRCGVAVPTVPHKVQDPSVLCTACATAIVKRAMAFGWPRIVLAWCVAMVLAAGCAFVYWTANYYDPDAHFHLFGVFCLVGIAVRVIIGVQNRAIAAGMAITIVLGALAMSEYELSRGYIMQQFTPAMDLTARQLALQPGIVWQYTCQRLLQDTFTLLCDAVLVGFTAFITLRGPTLWDPYANDV